MGKSYKRVFTLRLTEEDYGKIQQIAKRDNRSMANYIENLVKLRIESYEAENGAVVVWEEE